MERNVEAVNGSMGEVGAAEMAALLEELRTEHRALEARIAELDHHLSLSAEEQLELARLKKLKLAKKDQIASIGRHVH